LASSGVFAARAGAPSPSSVKRTRYAYSRLGQRQPNARRALSASVGFFYSPSMT
jgi:hypothetical protein